jgi:hypothetical protein
MVSTGVLIGGIFIVGLFVLGVVQTQLDLPQSRLAGAATSEPTQEALNICMKDCMRSCVTVAGTEPACLDKCNLRCGGP